MVEQKRFNCDDCIITSCTGGIYYIDGLYYKCDLFKPPEEKIINNICDDSIIKNCISGLYTKCVSYFNQKKEIKEKENYEISITKKIIKSLENPNDWNIYHSIDWCNKDTIMLQYSNTKGIIRVHTRLHTDKVTIATPTYGREPLTFNNKKLADLIRFICDCKKIEEKEKELKGMKEDIVDILG